MGFHPKRWFRRTFIVPLAGRRVDEGLDLPKGTTVNFIRQWKTYLVAISGLLAGIVGFTEGHISLGELLTLITGAGAAVGLSAKGNRIEDAVKKNGDTDTP